MRFFLDNTFAPRASRSFAALFEHEHTFQHLRERWPADTADEEWMPALIKDGDWIVLTHDRSINHQHSYLIQACRESSVLVVFLSATWSHLPFLMHHSKLLAYFEELLKQLKNSRPGTVLILGPRGAFRRI